MDAGQRGRTNGAIVDDLNEEPRPSLNLMRLLPVLLIALTAVGNAAFCLAVVMPQWSVYEQLTNQRDLAQTALTVQPEPDDSNQVVLQAQIDSASEDLNAAAVTFLSSAEADTLLDRLYAYADLSAVTIVSLQAQPQTVPDDDGAESESAPVYSVRTLRLQAEAEVQALMRFASRLQEARIPGVTLNDISVQPLNAGRAALVMVVEIYTSELSPGGALTAVPAPVMPTPVTTQPPTEPAAEVAAHTAPTASPQVVILPTAGSVTPTPDIDCPGAPPIRFQVGDEIVVDFNDSGALRILSQVRGRGGSLDVITQVYDNQPLTILAGPVCGPYNGQSIWYWYVEFDGIQGWAGEGPTDDYWLCPKELAECATKP